MDLEVLGRHALLFDDDSMATFVNSTDALVDWHSLKIDRYDARHLLFSPPPPRRRNRTREPLNADELALEAQLDYERYVDLPPVSDEPALKAEECSQTTNYQAVGFSYGNNDDSSAYQKDADVAPKSSEFQPPFHVPEDLPCLPQSDKVHQIISKTALFVSTHGGQSEIILRVKQGNNPSFGFLMPDNELHPYFRYLVENPQFLVSEPRDVHQKNRSVSPVSGGALSLLGSVYDSGDEDEADDTAKVDISKGIAERSCDAKKTESTSINPNKEKAFSVKKNSSVTTLKSGHVKSLLDGRLNPGSISTSAMNSSKVQPVVLEPPPEVKRLIHKLVEYIVRNGKQFEAMIIEQDREHGRFSFLLPSDKHHLYYSKVLRTAQESKGKTKSQKDGNNAGSGKDKGVKDSLFSDFPTESDRKDKFKMVINKSKKDASDTQPEVSQSEFTVDAAAAAAILEAATRGVKSSVIARSSPTDHVFSVNGGASERAPSSPFSRRSDKQRLDDVSAADEVVVQHPPSEEQKRLKAERLRRAKNFVAMLKSGEIPFKAGGEPPRGISRSDGGDRGSSDEMDNDNNAAAASAEPPEERRPKRKKDDDDNGAESLKKHRRRKHSTADDCSSDECGEKSRRSSSYREKKKHHSRRSHRDDRESKDEYDEYDDKKSLGKKKRDRVEYDDDDRRHTRRHHHHRHSNSRKSVSRNSDEEDDEFEKRSPPSSSSSHRNGPYRDGSRELVDAAAGGGVVVAATSQPSDTEVPDDLRAKIRAMLLATRL